MASTYTNSGIEKIGSGEQAGTWGTTTNNNLDIIDKSINGVQSLTLTGTTDTFTVVDGNLSDAGAKVLVLGGSPSGTHTLTLEPNDADKLHLVQNGTSQTVNISQGSGSNATLVAGEIAWVFCDGAGSGAAVTKQTISSSPATFTVGTDLTVTGDASVGDDLSLASDGAILNFGADSDVSLTHVADTGLLLNSTRQLQFNDASQNINAPSATVLDINATDEVEINATELEFNGTTADINANLDVSGTSTLTGNVTLGGQLIMPDVTNAKILVADGTSYQEVAVSGDVTIANTGAVTIANNAVETAMIADGQITTAKLAGSVAVIGMSAKVTVGTGTPTITASVNTSSIADNGTGDFTITIDTDYSNANFAATVTTFDDDGTNRNVGDNTVEAQAVGTIQIKTYRATPSEVSVRGAFDPDGFFVMSNAQ
jgi:hypothetical protein